MTDIQEAYELHSKGKLEEAKKLYIEFLNENPKQPDVSNLLGLVYLQKNEPTQAQAYFEHAVEGYPCAEYYQNLGLAHFKKKEYETAMDCFSKAVEFESKNLEFIRNFAQMAKKTNQYSKAVEFYEKCIALDPKDIVGLNNLGLMYEQLHDIKSAKTCYQKALKIKPSYEAAHNLGILYRNDRNFDESIKCFKQALKYKPNNPSTLTSIGMSYLCKKDLYEGYRYIHKSSTSVLNSKNVENFEKYWQGGKHPDKTVQVYYIAGYGDHIMFSRYIPFLKDYFKTIKVLVPFVLKSVFESNFPDIEIGKFTDKEFDYNINIMELPSVLKIDFNNIPHAQGYLKADEKIVQEYKTKYFNTSKKKIGLFWQGNDKVLKNRSIKLKELESLFELEGFDFYSFEKGDKEEQIKEFPNLIDLGPTFKSFAETAGALMNLDVLITVDSAIAHLAGALGVKTYLLLPYASEWRWFSDEKDTPWYDSVTIFKQKEHYDWTPVIEELRKSLKQ